MAIYIKGDIHGDYRPFSHGYFKEGADLTRDDYVIILGDFGFIWEKEESGYEKNWLDWLNDKPWTTLFIDGNHENFDRLYSFPTEEWNGGKVHKIRDNILHLCRGEIFTLEGKKFLAMGGAASHDIQHGIIDPADYSSKEEMKQACKNLEARCGGWRFAMYRIKGISWWAEEIPSMAERANARINLDKIDNKVDFILSHEAPSSVVNLLNRGYTPDEYSCWLENEIRQKVDYNRWYFGHYHINRRITDKEECLFEDMRRIM